MISEKKMLTLVAVSAVLSFLSVVLFMTAQMIGFSAYIPFGVTLISIVYPLAIYRWVYAHDLQVILRVFIALGAVVFAILIPMLQQ